MKLESPMRSALQPKCFKEAKGHVRDQIQQQCGGIADVSIVSKQ